MPVEFLSDDQVAVYGQFSGPVSPAELERFFFLDDGDLELVGRRRGEGRRLGFGVQLGTLMRHLAGDAITVYTAGTKHGKDLNTQSVESLAELGIDISGEHTKPITADMLADVDLIITLGSEAVVDPIPGIKIRNWDTDEPSLRGIEGMERMRLIRDDIKQVLPLVKGLSIDTVP